MCRHLMYVCMHSSSVPERHILALRQAEGISLELSMWDPAAKEHSLISPTEAPLALHRRFRASLLGASVRRKFSLVRAGDGEVPIFSRPISVAHGGWERGSFREAGLRPRRLGQLVGVGLCVRCSGRCPSEWTLNWGRLGRMDKERDQAQ